MLITRAYRFSCQQWSWCRLPWLRAASCLRRDQTSIGIIRRIGIDHVQDMSGECRRRRQNKLTTEEKAQTQHTVHDLLFRAASGSIAYSEHVPHTLTQSLCSHVFCFFSLLNLLSFFHEGFTPCQARVLSRPMTLPLTIPLSPLHLSSVATAGRLHDHESSRPCQEASCQAERAGHQACLKKQQERTDWLFNCNCCYS